MSDEEIANTSINFAFLSPVPNIAGDDQDEMIIYQIDVASYFYLDPTHS